MLFILSACKKDQPNLPDPIAATVTIESKPISTATNEISVKGLISLSDTNSVINRGFCISATPNPTTASIITKVPGGSGTLATSITGLMPGTTYYIRAFAVTAAGIAYSDNLKVTTDVVDIDGNIYKTVNIGNSVWLVQNLKVTHFRNGEPIDYLTREDDWRYLSGYCDYNFDSLLGDTYGHLYNFAAISDTRNICPAGWRLPKGDDWREIFWLPGLTNTATGAMKEAGTDHWISPNVGATNQTGFTGLPAGIRNNLGFYSLGTSTIYWSDPSEIYTTTLLNNVETVAGTMNGLRDGTGMMGCSVRCVKID